ncbi:hypothetical protein PR003_g14360 [Phytophthora rubi]|uniref:Uncharacterized protein n=1 Tax=Phytophthora rubi TaxID=129364 RepID=A0A6A3LDY5_9STRA|nr:hypothetical protein PR002_g14250 [Phytophthora rubi]KAE9332749.1 hypothetical protein PR003_g14360 [Phytophthora rubi]
MELAYDALIKSTKADKLVAVHLLMVLFCFRLIYEKVVTVISMNGGTTTALLNTMLPHTHMDVATDQRPAFYIDYLSEVQRPDHAALLGAGYPAQSASGLSAKIQHSAVW